MRCILVASAFAVLVSAARADDDDDDTPIPPIAGVGWMIGNGLGFLSGDVLAFPTPRLAIELQVAFNRESTAYGTLTAYAAAPIFRAYLADGSSPYIAVGVEITRKAVGALTWYSPGAIANAGYEWRASSGLALLVGAGLGYAPTVSAANRVQALTDKGFLGLNIEAGVRYVFR